MALGTRAAPDERVHVLIQFHTWPDPSTRQLLDRQYQVHLLDVVPDTAYFSSVPAPLLAKGTLLELSAMPIGTTATRAPGRLIRAVAPIRPDDKLAPWLVPGPVPTHALADQDRVAVLVLFFGDVPPERQQAVLKPRVSDVAGRIVPLNAWQVTLPQQALLALARADEVKWIEPIPAPPEVDNDGVRSANGVNADAVNLATAFAVSGQGVTIAQWEPDIASLQHGDLAGRIVLGDPPLRVTTRSWMHDETISANGTYDAGEGVYADMDDSASVTAGDVRFAVTGFAAGSTVAAGAADVGTGLAFFATSPAEKFADTVTADGVYSPGEAIYLDADSSWTVTAGDTLRTAAGTGVAAGTALSWFSTNPHYHATHVAGTAIGSGAQSNVPPNPGSANQWRGVAFRARLRAYDIRNTAELGPEYTNAANNAVTISTNSWGTSHCHQQLPPADCYDAASALYDAIVSGRQSDGSASGVATRLAIFGSAGNQGRPERHGESAAANGRYDVGEAIYVDWDDDGTVTAGDLRRLPPAGLAVNEVRIGDADVGTALVNFQAVEGHDELSSVNGLWDPAGPEGIYRDADGSGGVSPGDTRLNAVGGFAAGSVVAAGNADVGRFLRAFRLWGNVRIPNSAKDTVEVANVTSDSNVLSPSSSRGPTTDGRLKPDVAGPGDQAAGDGGVTSAFPGNRYLTLGGTSMATPAVAGTAALSTEWYRAACRAGNPRPSTLRALLVHGAVDLTQLRMFPGTFTGPDFAYGYGLVKADRTLARVPHHVEGTLAATGAVDAFTITIGAVENLQVTLAWDDPAWNAAAAASPVTGLLANDLDLEVVAPDGRTFTPWQFTAATPAQPAVLPAAVPSGSPVPAAARDRRNTIEQVVVPAAGPGTWTVRVRGGALALGPQDYSLVCDLFEPQQSPCAATPATDVWLRDNAGDTGTTPSTGRMWLSPDVWNRLAADGGTVHENPEYGQVNYLYANLRNRSGASAAATSVDLWLAPAAIGLRWPDNFTYVGRIPVANLAAGATRQVGPLAWDPPAPAPSSHFCFYIRAVSPQDPVLIVEGSGVGANASQSNNLAWRNINVVDIHSETPVTFLTRNVSDRAQEIDIVIDVPEEFLDLGAVGLTLSTALDEAWRANGAQGSGLAAGSVPVPIAGGPGFEQRLDPGGPRLPGEPKEAPRWPTRVTNPRAEVQAIRLGAHQAGAVTLSFASASTQRKVYPVDVLQRQNGEIVGGIRYLVRTGVNTGE